MVGSVSTRRACLGNCIPVEAPLATLGDVVRSKLRRRARPTSRAGGDHSLDGSCFADRIKEVCKHEFVSSVDTMSAPANDSESVCVPPQVCCIERRTAAQAGVSQEVGMLVVGHVVPCPICSALGMQ